MRLLKRKEKTTPKKFGFTKEVTAKALETWLNKREELQKKYEDLSAKHTGPVESLEMSGIRQQRELVEERIREVRDWYGLYVLEGLEEESRRLKWLTIVLIALTIVLTIFTGFLVSGIRVP